MKKLLIILFALPCFAMAQVSGDTLKVDSLTFVKGSSVNIGAGSKADGGYSFIYIAPANKKEAKGFIAAHINAVIYLAPGWKGYKMKIVDFKLIGNSTMGDKYYLILNAGQKHNYTCDPGLAFNAKEILP